MDEDGRKNSRIYIQIQGYGYTSEQQEICKMRIACLQIQPNAIVLERPYSARGR